MTETTKIESVDRAAKVKIKSDLNLDIMLTRYQAEHNV